jgi:hypothetical protein
VSKRLVSVPMRSSTRSRRTPIAKILPHRRSDVLVVPPATQVDRRIAKKSRLHEKSYPPDHEEQDLLCCLKCARKQRTMMVGTTYAREANGEKSDPWVRFLVKECVLTKQRYHKLTRHARAHARVTSCLLPALLQPIRAFTPVQDGGRFTLVLATFLFLCKTGEIVPSHNQEHSFPVVRSAHVQQRGTTSANSHARRKRGKSDP